MFSKCYGTCISISGFVQSIWINGNQTSVSDLGSLARSKQTTTLVLCDLYANAEVKILRDIMQYMCNNMQLVFLRLKWHTTYDLLRKQLLKENYFFSLFPSYHLSELYIVYITQVESKHTFKFFPFPHSLIKKAMKE